MSKPRLLFEPGLVFRYVLSIVPYRLVKGTSMSQSAQTRSRKNRFHSQKKSKRGTCHNRCLFDIAGRVHPASPQHPARGLSTFSKKPVPDSPMYPRFQAFLSRASCPGPGRDMTYQLAAFSICCLQIELAIIIRGYSNFSEESRIIINTIYC